MIENKTGTVLEFLDDNSGYVNDTTNPGTKIRFEHQGASAIFVIGEVVSYLLINTPGTTKAVNLGRPN